MIVSVDPTTGDHVCEHGTAVDVHCCGCHNGFIFDREHVCPPCANSVHAWSNDFGDDWTPARGTLCDCGGKAWNQ